MVVWLNVLYWYIGITGLLGIVGFEMAWKRLKMYRTIDTVRDQAYPHFSRPDARKWSRLHFYPTCVLMPTRILLMTIIVTLMVIFISIYSIGHNYEKGPIKKKTCRSFLMCVLHCCLFWLLMFMILIISFIFS